MLAFFIIVYVLVAVSYVLPPLNRIPKRHKIENEEAYYAELRKRERK